MEVSELSPSRIRVEGYGGVSINVWDHGGEGPPLVLNHCTGTHGRIWDPLVPALLKHFHVYAPETRGHGDSDKPEGDENYEWSRSGEDLLAVVDALALNDFRAVGHSAGAMHWVFAELSRPGTVKRAVLIDPIIGPSEAFSSPSPLGEISRRRRSEFPSFEAAIENFAAKPPMNRWTAEAREAYVRHGFLETPEGSVRLKCPGHIEGAVYDQSGSFELFSRLGEVQTEITLVTADESNVLMLVQEQHKRFPPHDYRVYEGVSHFIPQEIPNEIADLIVEKLA